MKTVRLICSNPNCGKEFEKSIYAYKQKRKYGQQNFYCCPEHAWSMMESIVVNPMRSNFL